MSGRYRRGMAPRESADAYVEYLERDTLPALPAIEGHRGAYVLRRDLGKELEFVVLTLWDSLEAVRALAGDDFRTAVVPPAARAALRNRFAHSGRPSMERPSSRREARAFG